MKKTYQRFAKGLAACLLVTALAAMPVFAGEIGDSGIDTTGGEYVTIGKDVVVYNDGYNKSYSPSVVYTYSIKPATVAAGTIVKDSNNTQMTVKAGIGDAVQNYDEDAGKATTTVTFTSAEQTDDGTKLSMAVRKNITFTFDLTKFENAGVYRYEITDETTAATLVAAGIVRPSDYEDVKYLDVYVINEIDTDTQEPTGNKVISGYVLLDQNVTEISQDATEKDPGFRSSVTDEKEIPEPGSEVPGTPGGENVTVTAGTTGKTGDNSFDYYYTYNVEVDKVITGNMADGTHQFPFTIDLTNEAGTTTGTTVYVGTDKTSLQSSENTSFEAGLANGGKYYVYGINPMAKVDIKEKNDTQNTYTASAKKDDAVVLTATEINNNEEAAAPQFAVSNYDKSATAVPAAIQGADTVVEFTNNLTVGTPTGVMMVAAPFAAVAAAIGGVFGVNKIKAKKKEEEQ